MIDVIPSTWQTNHLFVLVGGNPLPNYVAANTLLHSDGTLHLIYSPATSQVANRIQQESVQTIQATRHEIQDPANSAEVEEVIAQVLRKIAQGSVGLHYTGGTKAMAVHAHRAFRKFAASQRLSCIFTYLDADSLTMRRDDTVQAIPVQYCVEPTLETLFRLHGVELKTKPLHTVKFDKLNQALAEAHTSEEGQEAYDNWCQRFLRHPGNRKSDEKHRTAIREILDLSKQAEHGLPYAQMQGAMRVVVGASSRLAEEVEHFPQYPIPLPSASVLQGVSLAIRESFSARRGRDRSQECG